MKSLSTEPGEQMTSMLAQAQSSVDTSSMKNVLLMESTSLPIRIMSMIMSKLKTENLNYFLVNFLFFEILINSSN